MTEDSRVKVGRSEEKMHGPRGLAVAGFSTEEQRLLLDLIEKTIAPPLPVIFVGPSQAGMTVLDVLGLPDRFGLLEQSSSPRTVLMSGLLETELRDLMSAFRSIGLPRPLWATLTPFSEKWTLRDLLTHLAEEAEAFQRRRK
ncbi:MAG: DUF3783 domain-containing protein [Pseudomonadota bacterium]